MRLPSNINEKNSKRQKHEKSCALSVLNKCQQRSTSRFLRCEKPLFMLHEANIDSCLLLFPIASTEQLTAFHGKFEGSTTRFMIKKKKRQRSNTKTSKALLLQIKIHFFSVGVGYLLSAVESVGGDKQGTTLQQLQLGKQYKGQMKWRIYQSLLNKILMQNLETTKI